MQVGGPERHRPVQVDGGQGVGQSVGLMMGIKQGAKSTVDTGLRMKKRLEKSQAAMVAVHTMIHHDAP